MAFRILQLVMLLLPYPLLDLISVQGEHESRMTRYYLYLINILLIQYQLIYRKHFADD